MQRGAGADAVVFRVDELSAQRGSGAGTDGGSAASVGRDEMAAWGRADELSVWTFGGGSGRGFRVDGTGDAHDRSEAGVRVDADRTGRTGGSTGECTSDAGKRFERIAGGRTPSSDRGVE